ncbi:hypothetical protein ACLB2K_038045 [Fragaria x ananassa]
MNVSQFDGSAAFHGGGFMPPAANPTLDNSFFKNRDAQTHTLLPVTLKQFSDAIAGENGKMEFSIDGVVVSTVKLVGIVHEFVEKLTDATFILDDGTGRVECNRWSNEQVDTAEIEAISNGMYVRVHGRLRTFQGQKTINVFSVRPVDDYNEIASHFIECIYVHLYNSKLPKPQVGMGLATQSYMTNTQNQVGVGVTTQSYMTIPLNQVSGQYRHDGQRIIAERVFQVLNHPRYLQDGAHIDTMAQELKVPAKDILYAAKTLAEENRIYEIAEDCFKSLANG